VSAGAATGLRRPASNDRASPSSTIRKKGRAIAGGRAADTLVFVSRDDLESFSGAPFGADSVLIVDRSSRAACPWKSGHKKRP
jgi:hypothetical protein